EGIESAIRELSKSPETACVIADKDRVKKKMLIGKNYAGEGINLYMITWDTEKTFVGFVSDEIEKVYPSIIKNTKRGKFICVNKDIFNTVKDPNLKRIYY